MTAERRQAPGFRVTERIDSAAPKIPDYPLLPDDLLVREANGSFTKEAPGFCVGGFHLTPEQIATLHPVTFTTFGLDYAMTDVSP